MSIKNQPEYTSEKSKTPEFEAMETETMNAATVETTTKEEAMNTNTADNTASASVQATTAIATAAASSAVVAGSTPTKFKVAFADKNNVFDTATVEGLALAAPAIKGEQGSLFKGEDDLGSQIRFELISFNHRWTVGTGETDSESKEKFRVSVDGKTLSGSGDDMHAYLESLKAEGYSKAKISPYIDLWGFVVWSEKNGDVPVDARELCRVQCSQTSMGAFTAFATTRGLLESKGLAQPIDVIEIHAEKRVSGTNKFTNFSFHVPKP